MSVIRILLADDHAIVRAGIRKTIDEIPGLNVVAEVGDGPHLFEVLAHNPIDCLLIDLTMPNFEPIAAIREIRSLYPNLKILVVSAYDDNIYVQGLLAAGVHGYHLKDQPLNDLKLAIQRVLAGERWISSPLIGKLVDITPGNEVSPHLTSRQRELMRLLKQGCDNQTIAQEMQLSVKTIENHLTRLYRQLNVESRLEAVNFIMRYPQFLGETGQKAARADPAIRPFTHTPGSLSILVVDDNARYRTQLKRLLGNLYPQATIYEAENISESVRLAQQVDIRLVLIDVVLGDDNGITCARRIKVFLPQCRIVLISAYPDREFHRQGLQSGAVAFLDKKDLDLPILRQLLDDLI